MTLRDFFGIAPCVAGFFWCAVDFGVSLGMSPCFCCHCLRPHLVASGLVSKRAVAVLIVDRSANSISTALGAAGCL